MSNLESISVRGEYFVITSEGRILLFSIKACADMYQRAYGGIVFTSHMLDNDAHNSIKACADMYQRNNPSSAAKYEILDLLKKKIRYLQLNAQLSEDDIHEFIIDLQEKINEMK